jgi:hypothetical protein
MQSVRRQTDPELVAAAVPAYLLALEGLLAATPRDPRLLLTAAQGYAAFGALVERDAPDRARALYDRGRDCGLAALTRRRGGGDLRHLPYADFTAWCTRLRADDLPTVFWTAAAWGAAIGVSLQSPEALAGAPKAVYLMEWVAQREPGFEYGSPYLLLGVYHGALPPALGGRPDQARTCFERAIALSQGRNLLAYVLEARYYARPRLDRDLFVDLLETALAAPAGSAPELTLQNALAQTQARALLEDVDEWF